MNRKDEGAVLKNSQLKQKENHLFLRVKKKIMS